MITNDTNIANDTEYTEYCITNSTNDNEYHEYHIP